MLRLALFFLVSFHALAPLTVSAREDMIAGPVAAQIVRVIDGDTILVEAMPWPQQRIEVYVRLRGIDTPELNASCPSMRHKAEVARQALIDMTGNEANGKVFLRNISGDKYFGRIVADVRLSDGGDLAKQLHAAGLAVAYDGGRKARIDCVATGSVD